MKQKILLLLSVLVVCMVAPIFAGAQSAESAQIMQSSSAITITSPSSATVWTLGRANYIRFQAAGIPYLDIYATNVNTGQKSYILKKWRKTVLGYLVWSLPYTLAPGSYTMTIADASDPSNYFTTDPFLVRKLVSSIKINSPLTTSADQLLQLSATVLAANASDPSITWSIVRGTGAAKISQTGLITPVKAGTVNVTAKANDDSGIKTTVKVTITPAPEGAVLPASDAVCGDLDGQRYDHSTPVGFGSSIGLCSNGDPSETSGIYLPDGIEEDVTWKCTGYNGGADASCVAYFFNGSCGTANGKAFYHNNTGFAYDWGDDTLCATGTVVPQSGIRVPFPSIGKPASWTCKGSTGAVSPTCTASVSDQLTDGVCGVLNGQVYNDRTKVPVGFGANASKMCEKGTPSGVASIFRNMIKDDAVWKCLGLNGGADTTCMSTFYVGSCGSANKTYDYYSNGYGSDTFCNTGVPDVTPSFPSSGKKVTWACVGPVGTGNCEASLSSAPALTNFPTVSVPSSSGNILMLGAKNKIGSVTISASNQSSEKVRQIKFAVSISGQFSSGSQPPFTNIILADSNANQISGSSCSLSADKNYIICTLGDGTYAQDYVISAGQSQIFSLYATVNGYGGSASVKTTLNAAGFIWDDASTNGASNAGLSGTVIPSFPTNDFTVSQIPIPPSAAGASLLNSLFPCRSKWVGAGWSACKDGQQTQVWTDLNSCNSSMKQFTAVQSCK